MMGEKGSILNVLKVLEDPNTALRKAGVEECVANYPDVKIIQEIAGIKTQEEAVSKIFPGVKALDDVSISFVPGEIHALMGENGAEKSTFMKIITGIYQPDMEQIILDGKKVEMKNFRDAVAHDINMVSQKIQIIPEATVAENIVLDRIDKFKHGVAMDWKLINGTAK